MALGARCLQSFLYLRIAFLPSEPGTGNGVLLQLQIFKILLSAVTRIKLNFGWGKAAKYTVIFLLISFSLVGIY